MNRDRDISPPRKDDSDATGFALRGWFDMLAQHCFAGQELLIPEAQTNGARCALPLVREAETGHLSALANYYSFSYAPIVEGVADVATREALVREIAARLRGSAGRVSLYPLIDNDGDAMPEMLRRAFASAGWIALLTAQGSNHIVDLAGRNFASYWRNRPGALRASVKRKGRARRYDFEIHTQISDGLWNEYCSVYGASWKNAEPYPAMVHAIAHEAAQRGALRLGIARKGGRAVAAQLWTIEGGTACIHKIAHDNAEDMHSPGTLLSHHMFGHMIDNEHVSRIDYGTGDNAYKRDWMERTRPMLRLDCFDPRKPAQWWPALRTRISQLVRRPA
ncbi:GNAT family N-acetyltransferase [Sphingobium sp. DEHP117]|uniref:GNAT family N-acetyltransferase n=1 Tax=Sphingobium sp. DEHP117 TaxID=2993436 RepID=UPI0027D735D9|nr:GNAT family N-acetyltransferase [Sphingobium sp. DEHP117]MDQ4419639.1 GNAT family N-acetyltransferase [Sphingobium sp. DEHP117]